VFVQVITPSAGGPAERAGIGPRDVLLAIGERPMENISLYEAGDLLQGNEGSEVHTIPPTCLITCLNAVASPLIYYHKRSHPPACLSVGAFLGATLCKY